MKEKSCWPWDGTHKITEDSVARAGDVVVFGQNVQV